MAKYIENVSFFISHELNIQTEELKASRIFQSYNDLHHTQKIKDKELIKDLHKHLQKEEKNNISIDKITLTLSKFGICNLRIYCSSDEAINADKFSFDNQLKNVYIELNIFFKENDLIKKENDLNKFFKEVNPDSRYLYHQHIADSNLKSSVEWSVYTYDSSKVPCMSLDLDSLLLERNVLNYVFSQCYVELLDMKKINLPDIQKLLNANRKALAEHEFLLHELKAEYFEKFNDDARKQRLDEASKLHDRLEGNIEHLSEQLEDKRRHREAKIMEVIFFILGVIGLISIATGILALLPGSDKVCDVNSTSSQVLTTAYMYSVGDVGQFILMGAIGFASFVLFLIIMYLSFVILKKLWKKVRKQR